MGHIFTLGVSLILMGFSFIIMSFGCITNKYVVYVGLFMAVASIVIFLLGCNDLIFIDRSNFGG